MMGSVFSKTLYQKRYLILGWLAGVIFMVFITMSAFNSFSDGSIADSIAHMPPALQKLVGDLSSFKTIQGYIAQQIFALRVPMLLIILSITVLVGLTGGEEERGIVETQLTLPVGRTSLLLQKLAAALVVIVLASLGALIGIEIGLIVSHQHYNMLDVLPHLVSCLLVSVDYGLVGFAAAAASGRRSLALGLASGLAFLSFIINSMASSVSYFGTLDKATLFHYYTYKGGYHWPELSLLAGIAMLLIAIALVGFNRRDIRAR
jgi:ABC-2 type transport system permease protein